MKHISEEWKANKKDLFARGSMVISALAAIACAVSYYIIGAKVLPDGTLVEPFGLIPLGYLFLFVFIISFVCNSVVWISSKRRK